MPSVRGQIVWFNRTSGQGFVVAPDKRDYYFRSNGRFENGQFVVFGIGRNGGGELEAANVRADARHTGDAMRVFLDDRREAPPGWTLVKTAEEAIALVESGQVEQLSLDHDLGTELTGYDVLRRIEKILFDEQLDFRVPEIFLHTGNPVGRDRMRLALESIARLKIENEERINFIRAEGGCLCPVCDREYRGHPSDRVWDFLHVLCDGKRVKL